VKAVWTEGEIEAIKRVNLLIGEMLNTDWRLPEWKPSRNFRVWDSRADHGIKMAGAADWLTLKIVGWFRDRGWLAASFADDVIVAPVVEVIPPDRCLHISPAENEANILRCGLLSGAEAGRSTTGRSDAGQRLHVTFDVEEAAAWASDKLLGRHHPAGEWVMFEIDGRGIAGKVLRDPASQTGYLLESGAVGAEFLSVVRRWRVG
jgi:hypothetical protein